MPCLLAKYCEMKEVAYIDGDLITYRCAASAENNTQDVAEVRCDDLIRRVLHETNSLSHCIFLGGEGNFRYEIYPQYKAHRKEQEKPKWLEACREHLVRYWNATIVGGMETDDALGISQCSKDGESIIISLDKDLLQIPGHHYQWEISGTSVNGKHWVKPASYFFTSPLDSLRRLYSQVIAGDGADNIPSYDGKLRNTIPKFIQKHIDALEEFTEELDMYNYCLSLYEDEEVLKRNAQCLYILRKENVYWQPPNLGQKAENTPS